MADQSWQFLSVKAFLEQANWHNVHPLDMDVQGFSSERDLPWQQETVEFFFQNCPWSGVSKYRSVNRLNETLFSLSLSVEDYFNCFVWEKPKIYKAKLNTGNAAKKPEPSEPSFTLNDLSNLF